MKERQLTGFEIHRLIEENKRILEYSRVDKVFHSKRDLMIRLRTKPLNFNSVKNTQKNNDEEKKRKKVSLIFKIPNLFFMKEGYESFDDETSNFTALLRKRLNNKVLKEISQVGFDRIIELKFEGKDERFKLIIELFDKGIILLTEDKDKDKEDKIIAKYGSENTGRTFAINSKYKTPESTIKSPVEALNREKNGERSLKAPEEKEIVKILASDYGFGRLYAEEICFRSRINKMKRYGDLNKEELKSLNKTIKEVLAEHKNRIYLENGESKEVSCIEITHLNLAKKEFENFSKAIEEFVKDAKLNGKKKPLRKEEIIIKKQEETIEKLKRESEEDKIKAEKIYEHYNELKSIIEEINKIIKAQGTNKEKKEKILKLNEILKDRRIKIEEINFKDKKVRISIND